MPKCFNCGSDHWKDVSEYRAKKVDEKGQKIDMSICMECGAISYPSKIIDPVVLKEFYKKEYRPAPTVFNSFAGQRKNNFHYHFLHSLFQEWEKQGKTQPVICDVGCAYGMSLNFFKQIVPECHVYGTEWTETMKRVCYQEFGLHLADDIDTDIEHDLIMTYKVLEHQIDPLAELMKYRKIIKPDGYLYISVPTWFNQMADFGVDGFNIETYFHPNHINVWDKEMFESLLSRAGWEIVKEDQVIYSSTYLCKPSKEVTLLPFKHKPADIEAVLKRIKTASELVENYKYAEALNIYANYPAAWIAHLEMSRKNLTDLGWEAFKASFIDPMLASCPNSAEVYICATDYALRGRQYKEALEFAAIALSKRPHNATSYIQLINIYKEIAIHTKDEKEKVRNFKTAREIAVTLFNTSSQSRDHAINEMYLTGSMIPVGE